MTDDYVLGDKATDIFANQHLDQKVTDIIANQHLAPPPACAFMLDDMRNDEEDCLGDNVGAGENKVQSSELEDEEAAKSISDDEGEYKCDLNGEEYQSSGLADEGTCISDDEECVRGDLNDDHIHQSNGHEDDKTTRDDGVCLDEELNDEEYQSTANSVGTTNEEYQSSELGVKGKNNKYGRWKMGALILVFGLVLVAVVAGIGANNNRADFHTEEGVRGGETASVTVVPQENENEIENVSENITNDGETPPPSVCLPKESFEVAMAGEVEEYSCNRDVQCHSVPADNACIGNIGTICEGACNSPAACIDNQGDIQSCSCLGADACHGNEGDVGLFSCNGKNACKKNRAAIGMLSCNAHNRACFDNNGVVEFESCNGVKACLENYASISFKSCNNVKSCNENTGPVGEQSCNGQESCLKNTGTIGAKSCNGEKSCCGNTEDRGHGECNADFECCNADVSQCECPSSQTNITSLEETPADAVSNSSEVFSG